MGHKLMSMEAALDEERKEVLAILESTGAGGRGRGLNNAARNASPFTTQRAPVRSMLDVQSAPPKQASKPASGPATTAPPVRSMLDISSPPPVRSMLDIGTTGPTTAPAVKCSSSKSPSPQLHRPVMRSAQSSSPPESQHHVAPVKGQHRSLSEVNPRPSDLGYRAPGFELPSQYGLSGYVHHNPVGPAAPKRNTQAGKKSQPSGAMAETMRGSEVGSFGPWETGRQVMAAAGIGKRMEKSTSPSGRLGLGLRSKSPQASMLSPDMSKFTLHDGRVIDMHSAYRHLSDANLMRSGSALSSLGEQSQRRRTNSGDAAMPGEAGGGRLEKVYEAENGSEYSSDEGEAPSDEDEHEERRGRRQEKKGGDHEHDHEPPTTLGLGRAMGPRTARSLMAAAEEERVAVSSKYAVRSLLEPETTAASARTEKPRSTRPTVHPRTAFDDRSGLNTPVDSDAEADLTDIRRAQKLSLHMTTVTSTPAVERSVRTIYRGDFAQMQQDAHDNQRRVRRYLVASDLSDEAAHAMEWTIGTVLRDGDTLLAIYCIDEEHRHTPIDAVTEDPLKGQAAAIVSAVKAAVPAVPGAPSVLPSPLSAAAHAPAGIVSAHTSPAGRGKGAAEQERFQAVQEITALVTKLLRKTKLQVKVVVEVIHCKSPKHLITEVIDHLSPTLVILGSRGRSALQGVILGSFSNYLVTKSSVPVMVARKRLRKHAKYRRPDIKLANNLSSPAIRTLADASIDRPLM